MLRPPVPFATAPGVRALTDLVFDNFGSPASLTSSVDSQKRVVDLPAFADPLFTTLSTTWSVPPCGTSAARADTDFT